MIWVMLTKKYGLNAAYGCYAAYSTYLAGLRVVCGQFAFLYGWYTAVKLLATVRAGIDYVYMERIYQYSYFHVVALRRLFARISIIYHLSKRWCVWKKSHRDHSTNGFPSKTCVFKIMPIPSPTGTPKFPNQINTQQTFIKFEKLKSSDAKCQM